MSNLDYEQRMSALNRLIHETLGVSLSTVRAAYGRARNTNIKVRSESTQTGSMPVSSARPLCLSELIADYDGEFMPEASRLYQSSWDAPVSHFPFVDMPIVAGASFLSRFRKAENVNERSTNSGSMLVFSNADEPASDWHKLRNEFWMIARADSSVMERYRRDVLG